VLKKPYGELVVVAVGMVHPSVAEEIDVEVANGGQAVRELDPAWVRHCAERPAEVLEPWSAEAGHNAAIVHFAASNLRREDVDDA
jgi:hypothetical protein